MNIERTYSKSLIKMIMFDKALLETTREGDVDVSNVDIDPEKDCYLLATTDVGVLGLSVFNPLNSVTLDYHPNLLPEHRGKNTKEFILRSLGWVVDNAPMYKKVNVKIPCCYPHIERYARNIGFKAEGLDRQSFCKGGKLVDQWLGGMTREEIEVQLCQL